MARNITKPKPASIGTVQPNYLVDQVLSALRAALESDVYKPGDKLPSEARLAAEFGVGRSTVREALRVLSHLGLVETWSGKGTFVVHTHTPPIEVSDTLQLDDIKDIYDFRYALEIAAAELAAMYRSEAQLDTLKTLLERARQAITRGDIDATVGLDTDFHIAVLEAGHCRFAASVYRANRDRIESAARAIIAMNDIQARERPSLGVQSIHADLIDAIERQDAHAAIVAVRGDQREVHARLRMQAEADGAATSSSPAAP